MSILQRLLPALDLIVIGSFCKDSQAADIGDAITGNWRLHLEIDPIDFRKAEEGDEPMTDDEFERDFTGVEYLLCYKIGEEYPAAYTFRKDGSIVVSVLPHADHRSVAAKVEGVGTWKISRKGELVEATLNLTRQDLEKEPEADPAEKWTAKISLRFRTENVLDVVTGSETLVNHHSRWVVRAALRRLDADGKDVLTDDEDPLIGKWVMTTNTPPFVAKVLKDHSMPVPERVRWGVIEFERGGIGRVLSSLNDRSGGINLNRKDLVGARDTLQMLFEVQSHRVSQTKFVDREKLKLETRFLWKTGTSTTKGRPLFTNVSNPGELMPPFIFVKEKVDSSLELVLGDAVLYELTTFDAKAEAEAKAAVWKAEFAARKRTWTSKGGTFSVEALMVAYRKGGIITLKKDDESEVDVELKELSNADRRWAVQEAKERGWLD